MKDKDLLIDNEKNFRKQMENASAFLINNQVICKKICKKIIYLIFK